MNATALNSRHSAPIFSSSSRVNTFPHGFEGVQTTTLETSYYVDTEITLVAVRKDHEPFGGIAAFRQLRTDSER